MKHLSVKIFKDNEFLAHSNLSELRKTMKNEMVQPSFRDISAIVDAEHFELHEVRRLRKLQ